MDLSDVFKRYIVKNVKRNAENSVKIDRFRESGMEPSWPSALAPVVEPVGGIKPREAQKPRRMRR